MPLGKGQQLLLQPARRRGETFLLALGDGVQGKLHEVEGELTRRLKRLAIAGGIDVADASRPRNLSIDVQLREPVHGVAYLLS